MAPEPGTHPPPAVACPVWLSVLYPLPSAHPHAPTPGGLIPSPWWPHSLAPHDNGFYFCGFNKNYTSSSGLAGGGPWSWGLVASSLNPNPSVNLVPSLNSPGCSWLGRASFLDLVLGGSQGKRSRDGRPVFCQGPLGCLYHLQAITKLSKIGPLLTK